MAKKYKTQKKKTTAHYVLTTLIKILLFIVVIIFAFIAYTKVNFSTKSLSFDSLQKKPSNAPAPSELKWFDDFKGVENVQKSRSGKKEPKKQKDTREPKSGFKFQGFGK